MEWKFVYDRYVKITIKGHRKRARDRSCGHDQNVRGNSLLAQCSPLQDTKPMLLVDNNEPEVRKLDVLLYQSVGSKYDIGPTAPNVFKNVLTQFLPLTADQEPGIHGSRAEVLLKRAKVLFSQQFGGRHEGNLVTIVNCKQGRKQGNNGLSATHIPLKESVHRFCRFHVIDNFFDHPYLRLGQFKRELLKQILGKSAFFWVRDRLGFLLEQPFPERKH